MVPSSFFREMRKLAMSAEAASSTGLQKGDLILTSMGPTTYLHDPKASRWDKFREKLYRRFAPRLQGGYTHTAIYTGRGQVIEARGDGVQKRTLREALKDIDGAVVVRPDTSKRVKQRAVAFAEASKGKPYAPDSVLGRQGAALLAAKLEPLLDGDVSPEGADSFTCANLAAASYTAGGFNPREGKGSWTLTTTGDFLNPKKVKLVKLLGKRIDAPPRAGRLKGRTLAV